ncbi:WhiB family transcriptional regulator [Streptomyces bullii]|uniref:WhiB family transcriptional regulator n=1 Tax=Streptomyces bullii TaxID=349910 RepID=A0ABW0URL8_9ACTN
MSGYIGQFPDTLARPLEWQADAVCRHDPDLFFEPTREGEAKKVCFACPTLLNCQSWVMARERGMSSHARDDAIIAGLNRAERFALDPAAPKQEPAEDKPPAATKPLEEREHGKRSTYKAGCRCGPCKAAAREYNEELKRRKERGEAPAKSGRKPSACPSVSAYRRHLRLGEPIDDGCRAAYAKHRATKRADRRSRQVYALWSKGLSDPDISAELGIGVRAVRNTRDRLGLIANLHVARPL